MTLMGHHSCMLAMHKCGAALHFKTLEAYGVSGLQEWTVNEISAAGGAVMNSLVSVRFTELDRHVINGHFYFFIF